MVMMYDSMTQSQPSTPRRSIVQKKGQVTIPTDLRKKWGLAEGDLVAFIETDRGILISPQEAIATAAGSPWLQELYERFASVREEASHVSEQEVNTAIDAAVSAVRKQHE